ncbi:PAS domain-containing protein [Clostridium sp. 19966]|uniref:PAS domain-containing sensor histidine kinase n=1 Tax=Clostridium sp. 19966 TaxID=2768166 RepID=UPI0028DE5BF4|nr:PAS domain-containing protein [Clostridium sp. 19966]MDT8719407.1 PAS domain-containing protein [Clostridium sp. 19966]
MQNIRFCDELNDFAFIAVKNNIVAKVNQHFIQMTQYKTKELLNKDINDIFRSLRIGPNFNCEETEDNNGYFIFTKYLEVKFVDIKITYQNELIIYSFVEKTKSNFNGIVSFTDSVSKNEHCGMGIYSFPDNILLKANDKFLSFFDEPFNKKKNTIGLGIKHTLNGVKEAIYSDMFKKVISTGKNVNIDEYKYDGLRRGTTYWKISLIPIYEGSNIEYCVAITEDITDQVLRRKRIEEQNLIIKQQNEKLKLQATLLEMSREAIFAWNIDGTIVYWNKGAEIMYGYTSGEALGSVCHDLLKSVLMQDFKKIKAQVLQDGFWSGEIQHTTKDGRALVVQAMHQMIMDEDGNKMILQTNKNITETIIERKLMEEQSKKLEATIESVGDILTIIDKDERFLTQSKTEKSYFEPNGFTLSDRYNKAEYFDFKGNRLKKEELCEYRVLNGEKVRELAFKKKEKGKEYYYITKGVPVLDSKGEVELGVFMTMDITDLMLKEQKIRAQNTLLEAIIRSMRESVYIYDSNGNYLIKKVSDDKSLAEAYDRFQEYFDMPEAFDFNENEITFEENVSSEVLRGRTVKDEILKYEKNGQYSYSVVSGVPVYDENNKLIYGITSTRDITDIVRNQEVLKDTQDKLLAVERENNETLKKALEMKDEFLSLISHEFRTPLNVINSAVQSIEYFHKKDLPDRVNNYLRMIKQNTFRQLRLVNNLLDITRANAGSIKINKRNLDIVFLTQSIVESVKPYAAQKNITMNFKSSLKSKIIGIDDEKYERILLNLISNAIKFTSTGDYISVELTYNEDTICLEVKDNGIGIPEDKLDVIFERFGQVDSSLSRQSEGSGIGLSLVKKFVEALGGRVSVKSKLGNGSTFRIFIPDKIIDDNEENRHVGDLLENHIVQSINVEFSDIYL